jgi:hypothetical protein
VVGFMPWLLFPQGKSPWYPLDRWLGGPESHSGRGGEEKNSQPPPGIGPWHSDLAHRLVAIPTELSRLLIQGYKAKVNVKSLGLTKHDAMKTY